MKIEAVKRLTALTPPWYDRSVAQVPSYLPHIKNKTTPFPRTSLELMEKLKGTNGDWEASWTVDFTGHITILFQTSFYNACLKAGLEWELVHVMQHEYVEAKLTIAAARKKYPDASPFVMAEKDVQLGGNAHEAAIKELDGISSLEYDKWSTKIIKYLQSYRSK